MVITPIVLVSVVFMFTQEQPKQYDSSTRIYTGIATGSSIVSLEESKLDLFGTRIAFDNLINLIRTKTTIEEVALRLFTKHMLLDGPKEAVIQVEHYKALMKIVPAEVKALIVKNDPEQSYLNLLEYKNKDYTNFIYELIHLGHRNYSSKEILKEIKVSRVQSSDMVKISFNSDDPGICANTLEFINEVFVRVYANLKVNQSDAVVGYFLKEIENAIYNLNLAEEELVTFNKRYNIINYYEQTRHIASEKEHFDLMYTEIQMKHMAVASVLHLLETKMSRYEIRRVNSNEMLALRERLSEIKHQVWLKSNFSPLKEISSQKDSIELNELKKEEALVEDEFGKLVDNYYGFNNSKEGVAGNSILERWLEKMIEFESSKAQLKVGDEIKKDFVKLFKRYAPLGATMKRLERKINVAEQKYLSLLESLNKAKLKQQNIELNSNLTIVAPPFFPIEARASKRKFLLVIAFMIGIVIPAFIIIVLEFVDASIKSVARAEDFIGYKVLAMFPNLRNPNKNLDVDFVKKRTLEILIRKLLLLKSAVRGGTTPVQITLFSNQKGEGKSFVFDTLIDKLNELDYKCLYLTHNIIDSSTSTIKKTYEITPMFHRAKAIDQLVDSDFKKEDFDYVFVEIPAVMKNTYPVELVRESDHAIMLVRANRAWSSADENSLNDFKSVAKKDTIQVLLNGVELTEMENILGDLPKKRSFFRRFIKNALRLRFYTKKNIS